MVVFSSSYLIISFSCPFSLNLSLFLIFYFLTFSATSSYYFITLIIFSSPQWHFFILIVLTVSFSWFFVFVIIFFIFYLLVPFCVISLFLYLSCDLSAFIHICYSFTYLLLIYCGFPCCLYFIYLFLFLFVDCCFVTSTSVIQLKRLVVVTVEGVPMAAGAGEWDQDIFCWRELSVNPKFLGFVVDDSGFFFTVKKTG